MRASKGVHLVVPRSAIDGADVAGAGGTQAGLILRTPTSVLFVIPWGEHWIVGTTDTPWRLDRDHPAASSADIDYLLDQVNRVLVRPVTARPDPRRLRRPAAAAGGGVRRDQPALPRARRRHARAGARARRRRQVHDLPGHGRGRRRRRRRRAARRAGRRAPRTCRWSARSAGPRSADRGAELAAGAGLPEDAVARLLRRHGDRIGDVLDLARADPALARPLAGAPGLPGRRGRARGPRRGRAAPRRRPDPPDPRVDRDRAPRRRVRAARSPR